MTQRSVTSRIYVGLVVAFRFGGIYLFLGGIYLCAQEINPQFFQKSIGLETVVILDAEAQALLLTTYKIYF